MPVIKVLDSMRVPEWVWLERAAPFYTHLQACYPMLATLSGLILSLCLPHPGYGIIALIPFLWVLLSGQHKHVGYFMAALVVGSGWGLFEREKMLDASCEGERVSVAGRVVSLPRKILSEFEGSGSVITVRSDTIKPMACATPGLIQVQIPDALEPAVLGHRLSASGIIRRKPAQWNPGRPPDQAGHFARGITTTLRAAEFNLLPGEPGFIDRLRRDLAEEIGRAVKRQRPKGLVQALTLGDGAGLSRLDWLRFRELGITHALVISGLHVGLLFLVVWRFSRRLLLCVVPSQMTRRDFSVMPALGIAFVYALLAGFSLPTQRALIMLMVFAISQITIWRSGSSHCLLLAAFGMLVIHPAAILGPSFWLSLMATAVLVCINQLISRAPILTERGKLVKAIIIQCGVVMAMTPWVDFWYSAAGVIAIVANLTVVPLLIMTVVPASLLALFISMTGLTADTHHWSPARWFSGGWLGLVDAFSWQIGAADVDEPLIGAVLRATHPATNMGVSKALNTSAVGFRLVVLDVGQGLSTFVQSGESSLLYDTGDASPSGFSQTEHVILPFLRYEQIDLIDVLVLSHGDRDHIGGVGKLRNEVSFYKTYGHYGEPCRPGKRIALGQATEITFLNGSLAKLGSPPHLSSGVAESDNDGSCVVLVEHRGRRFLLAGDIEGAREQAMVRYWRDTLAVDVLVAAHHGSDTSSTATFLKWATPDFVAFSAGRGNRFGHPSAQVINRFAARGTKPALTAADGAITYSINDLGNITVEAMRDGTIPYWLQLP